MRRAILLAAIALFAISASAQQRQGVLIKASKPYDNLVTTIEQLGGTVIYKYKYVDGLAADLTWVGEGAVSKEVGFTPPQTVDVLILNPLAEPNGLAWPLLDTPRMIFFAEPPAPDEALGAYAARLMIAEEHFGMVVKLFDHWGLSTGDQAALQLGQLLGAQYVIVGNVALEPRQARLDIRILDVETGAIHLADKRTGKRDEFLAIVSGLADRFTRDLKLPARRETVVVQVPARASFAYSRGLDYETRGQWERARAMYRQALEHYADHADARTALDRLRGRGGGQ